MKINRILLAVVVLVVLLAMALAYIAIDKMQQQSEAQMQAAAQDGYARGIDWCVAAIFAQTSNCQLAVVRVGNSTRQLVDTACLVGQQ